MTEHEASRTLVKSSPELWAECSDAALLGRHLDHFGEIRITRLEPETAVAWEGERASGTVRLQPSGWGTRVVLTVRAEPQAPGRVEPEPELDARRPEPWPPEPEPAPPDPPEPEPLPPAAGPVRETHAIPARRGLLARMREFLWPPNPELEAEPENPHLPARAGAAEPESMPGPALMPVPVPVPVPTLARLTPADKAERKAHEAALAAALESLGQAHHRPFSRP